MRSRTASRSSGFLSFVSGFVMALATVVVLTSCTATTFQRDWNKIATFTAAVDSGCALALPIALQMQNDPTFGPYVAAGVIAGCSTAAGVAKLMSNPNTPVWLGQQMQMLKDALDRLKARSPTRPV